MEKILAAERARLDALEEVKTHITKFKRSLRKFDAQGEKELVLNKPKEPMVPPIVTRTGVRPRMATVRVSCEVCDGWEFEIHGGEMDQLRKKKSLYCEHGRLVRELVMKQTTYEAVRPIRQLYKKVIQHLPPSQFSSNTSEVTTAKLEGL